MISLVLAAAVVIALVSPGVAQDAPDGVFTGGSQRFVWKSAAAHDEWQRMAGTGQGQRPIGSLIACEVDSGTSFVVRYAIPPRGYGIEVVDGPKKGCQGVALTETIDLHDKTAPEQPKPGATRARSRETSASGAGKAHAPVNPRDNLAVRPIVPPLPPGGALPIRPGLR